MKKILLLTCVTITAITAFSQNHQLKLTNPARKNPVFIKEGDKVLMAIKVPRSLVLKKPSDIYKLSGSELMDSVYVFSKGRIRSISDSIVLMQERNSFLSATNRKIRVEKINTLRKLGAGKQVLRTVTTIGTGLAAGITIFYSYAATPGNCDGCLTGMAYAAGTTVVASRFSRQKIRKKHLDNWKIEVVALP